MAEWISEQSRSERKREMRKTKGGREMISEREAQGGGLRKTKVQGKIKKNKTLWSLTGERDASSDQQEAPVVLSKCLEDAGVRFDLNQRRMSTVVSIQADNAVTHTCSGSILCFCSFIRKKRNIMASFSRNFSLGNLQDGCVD